MDWIRNKIDEKLPNKERGPYPVPTNIRRFPQPTAATAATLTTTQEENDTPYTKQTSVVKYVVLGFSVVYWMLGFVFVLYSYYMSDEMDPFLYNFIVKPGAVVMVHGLVIILISMVGVVGAFRENIRLLKLYKYILIATLLLQVRIY